MKIKLFFIMTFFISSISFSQKPKVNYEYIGDGVYKFSAVGDFSGENARNSISFEIQDFERKNNVIQDYVRQERIEIESVNFKRQFRYEVLMKFYRTKDSILFVSPEEFANNNAKIIETLKQYKKLKDDKVFQDGKYLELIDKLIDSLVVF